MPEQATKLEDVLKTDPPRLVILFQRAKNGDEQFQWGVVGHIPILTVIGYITRIQSELAFRSPDNCDESALVITWDKDKKKLSYWVNADIPVDPLVGMLETIKEALVNSRLAQQALSQQAKIVGIDGKPIKKVT